MVRGIERRFWLIYCAVGYESFSDADTAQSWSILTRYRCIDPSAPCVDDSDITVDMVENCDYAQNIGNGNCDLENNNEHCGER